MGCVSFFPYTGEKMPNATIKTVTVAAGNTIKAGIFVTYVSGSTTQVQVPPSGTTSFDGVARTSGVGGDTITIYTP